MESFKQYRPPSQKLDLFQPRKRYDVFLSFRGPDVRDTLATKLFRALQQEGLRVFLDSQRLEKGENIGISLQEAIKDSRVHIPIFSGGYASSTWCLGELSLMWSCKATGAGSSIIPLFYDVEPWHVRYLDSEKSPYAEALKKHSESTRHSKEEIEEWKKALYEVSSLSGWTLALTASGDEDKLVQRITEDLQAYKIKDLHIAKHPVGLDARIDEVTKELQGIADHQRRITIGIWGMGGSGKTTLLKFIYNHIHHMFQACHFAADIRAIARESGMGLRNLQKDVLKNLAKHDVDLFNIDQGKTEMQIHLASIKALVLLDDVDKDEHLDALLGDWYGPGSIIIITTRDKEVLQRREVDKILAMEGLSPKEAVQLFSWHAFGRESPEKYYEDMTEQIVRACGGLPLSLEILGAHLRPKRDLRIWKEALQRIQNVGYDKLYKSLRISYDALTGNEKQIFLDIACFFIVFGRVFPFSKEFYIKFWEVLGRKAVYTSLENLEGKSLIVVHEYTHKSTWHGLRHKSTWHGSIACEFRMHDHLRDFGRQIVEEQSPDNPHLRSRLWCKEDIISAIAQAEETSTVQGIMWRERLDYEVEQVDSLVSMNNLKFMFCWDLVLKREITKLPRNLRYLVLSECKVKQLGSFSEMPASTDGYSSFFFSMPKAIGQLKFLRYLDMSGTPLGLLPNEFGELFSLEELYLIGCSLIELPHNFGNLIKLKFLDISGNGLKSFPENFSQLSLEYLDACHNKFEELTTLPDSLVHLNVSFCGFLQKLSPISHITNLHTIELSGCRSLTELPKVDTMHSLTKLSLYGCKNLKELPVLPRSLTSLVLEQCENLQRMPCMRDMKNLECIELYECPSLGELPELEALRSLTELRVDGCENLKEFPVLPRSLTSLTLQWCDNLERMSCMRDMKNLECIVLSGCASLGELPELETLQSLKELKLSRCWKLEKLPVLPRSLISLTLEYCNNLQSMSCMHDMKNLECIDLCRCPSLGELPELEALHSLTKLRLEGCGDLKEVPVLPRSLTSLTIEYCHNLQRMSSMRDMKNLDCIVLFGCLSLGELPELEALHSLTKLKLEGCDDLKELPLLPRSLTSLTIEYCQNLRRISYMLDMKNLECIVLSGCPSLGELPESEALHSLTKLRLEGCGDVKELPLLPISLTSLTLEYCDNLQRISCFHDMKNLECIELSRCPSLGELPELEALHSLRKLRLKGCGDLKELPVLPRSLTSLTIVYCHNLQRMSNIRDMKNLECIVLSGCLSLGELPELVALHSLTKLRLEGCGHLKELPLLPSSLTSLTIEYCHNLQRMSCMRDMQNLECIVLSGCLSLGELPELGALHSLTKLRLEGFGDLKELPIIPRSLTSLALEYCPNLQKMSCMRDMKNLECIELCRCQGLGELPELDALHSLTKLRLEGCDDLKELHVLPTSLTSLTVEYCHNLQRMSCMRDMKNLKCIVLSGCLNLGELPELEALHSLTKLRLEGCGDLKELPVLPKSLTSLTIEYCHNLQRMSRMRDMKNLECIVLSGCLSLGELPELEALHSLTNLRLEGCGHLKELPVLPKSLTSLTIEYCSDLQRMSFMRDMKNLECIVLSGCQSLVELPELEALHSLTKLRLERCGDLKELPVLSRSLTSLTIEYCDNLQKMSCMLDMKNLECIELCRCPNLGELPELEALHSLTKLRLERCGDLKELPVLPRSLTSLTIEYCHNLKRMSCMGDMKHLECIELCRCPSLGELPELEALHSLRKLRLEGCDDLKELPVLPRSLTSPTIEYCHNLQRMSCMRDMKNLECIVLSGCANLSELPELEALQSLKELKLSRCRKLEKLPPLPEGPVNISIINCFKLQNNSGRPLLDPKRRRVREFPLLDGITSDGWTSAASEEMVDCGLISGSEIPLINLKRRRVAELSPSEVGGGRGSPLSLPIGRLNLDSQIHL